MTKAASVLLVFVGFSVFMVGCVTCQNGNRTCCKECWENTDFQSNVSRSQSCEVTDMRNALFSSVGHAIHLAGQRLVVHYWTLLRCYTCASEHQGTQNIKQNNNNMQI